MLNKVQQLFIGKSDGAANSSVTTLVTDAASVVAGDIYLVNSALTVIAAAGDITPIVYIAQGTGTGTYKLSAPIPVGNIVNARSQAYAAPAQKVVHLGNVGSGGLDLTFLNGRTYNLSILLKDDQRFMPQRQTRRDYSFTADFAATTPTEAEQDAFAGLFVSAINADAYLSDFIIAAHVETGTLSGIRLTGLAQTYNRLNNRPEYVDFIASLYDVTDSTSTYTATVTVSTAYNPGHGTPQQIDALERKLIAWEGHTNKIQFPVIEPTYFTSLTTTYNVVNIDWFAETPGILEGRDKKPFGAILAFCSSVTTQYAAFITVLELFNNSGAGTISNNISFVDADV